MFQILREDGVDSSNGQVRLRSVQFQYSTKLNAIMEFLKSVQAENPSFKTVIFSQWATMLNVIEVGLKEAGISHVRLDGSLREKDRYFF
jgi:SNF2 family DNA or RNA helicase